MRKRTRARECALQILYQWDTTQADLAEILTEVPEHAKQDPEVRAYAELLAKGVHDRLASIDKTIERFAENWEMKRMSFVDRNILRLSTYEMLHVEEIPVKVAINEAVELAKRFGESDSSKFVNGILDKIAKTECKK